MYFKNSEEFNINVFFFLFYIVYHFQTTNELQKHKKFDLSKDLLLFKRLASKNICFLPGYFEQIDR